MADRKKSCRHQLRVVRLKYAVVARLASRPISIWCVICVAPRWMGERSCCAKLSSRP
jgi:hypothetical protein